jgi:putative endonuclease
MVGRFASIAVYIMASGRNGTLYVGVTSDLEKRVSHHKRGVVPGFTDRYGCKSLVWYELHERMADAIRREKQLKHWLRAWKLALIDDANPAWRDLSEGWFEETTSEWVIGRPEYGAP